jgi:glyoxylase-like metal-dependent hydrolase (beta-lactamase superfamily II)
MQIGDWDVQSFMSGAFKLDGGGMFGVVPRKLWSKAAPADDQNRIQMVMRLLLIRGQDKTIVVDAGAGEGWGDKITRIYDFESYTPMEQALAPFDVSPADVTDVLVTHLHFDHGGGLARPDGDGWRLAFPNARHHLQTSQWEHANQPNPRDRASYFKERIEIIDREGELVLHNGHWSVGTGLDLLVFDGHTPGQQLPKLSDGTTTLFHAGDLVPMVAHFPTPYIMAYDLLPVLSMEEKVRILGQAAKEDWILFFEHDPGVEACRLKVEEGRYFPGESVKLG